MGLQLADQPAGGDPLPMPDLAELDAVLRTFTENPCLCFETRERFLELRTVFKARPVQPMSWAHAMVLRLSLAVIAQPSTRSRLCGSSHVCRASGPGVGESEQC